MNPLYPDFRDHPEGPLDPDVFGPLTSLGEARRRCQQVAQRREVLGQQMRLLCRLWRSQFRQPPVWLSIHGQAPGARLRWRRRAAHPAAQTYLELTGEAGQALLRSLSPAVVRVMLDFDRRAAHLNLHFNLASYELRRLKAYRQHLETLAAWEKNHHASDERFFMAGTGRRCCDGSATDDTRRP
ncbi:MAG: hypothetical protein ACLFSK_08450 [Ectothiorhodospira sp.]